ncbi:MAG: hypothetical protein ACE5GM_00770 [bacterium]
MLQQMKIVGKVKGRYILFIAIGSWLLAGCCGPIYSYTLHKMLEGEKNYSFQADPGFGKKKLRIGVIPFVSGPRSERVSSGKDHLLFAREFARKIKTFQFLPLKTVNGYSPEETLQYLKKNGLSEFLKWIEYKHPLNAILYARVTEEKSGFAPGRGLALQNRVDLYIMDSHGKILFEATQTRYDIFDSVLRNMAGRFAGTMKELTVKKPDEQ